MSGIKLLVYNLEKEKRHFAEFSLLLDSFESQKSKAFTTAQLREKYILRRAILRKELAKFTGSSTEKINYNTNEFQKPFLENGDVQFNCSHSNNYFVIAISGNTELGVDIEHYRELNDLDLTAERAFSINEFTKWMSVAEDEKLDIFYRIWTRKEAIIKAIGMGLSYPLSDFDVSIGKNNVGVVLSKDKDWPADSWSMHHWELDGYVLALAYQGEKQKVELIIR